MPYKPRPITHHARPRESRKHDRTTTERGYGWDWQQFRIQFIAQHPLCADCAGEGIVSPTEDIHHLTKIKHAPHMRLDDENLLPLCKRHHRMRTAKGE
jgi:5-methylcytosine-specific restriction protein A